MPRLTKKKRACRAATLASQVARRRENWKVPELEDTEQDELETFDQELVMEEDGFAQLKTSMMEDSGSTIKYQRGCKKSRQTTWRDKRKQMDLRKAATGTALITQYFKDPSETIDNATSSAPEQPVLVEAVPTAAEIKEAALVAGVKELKESL